jgi:hypothetical protein
VPFSDNSTPEAAVTNYFAALARHDTTLARDLLDPKSRTSVASAAASGFTDLVKLDDVHVLSVQTGTKYRPDVNGYTFPRQIEFALVTVAYSPTFSASDQTDSGPATKQVTLGQSAKAKRWLILAIGS